MPEPSTSKEESKEECAWCKWMKAGQCRETFEAWQACVDGVMGEDLDPTARKEAVDKCSNVTQPLFECMMRHRDYYSSQLEGMGVPPQSSSGGGSGGDSAPGSGSGGDSSGQAAASKGGSTQVRVSVGSSSGKEAATATAPS